MGFYENAQLARLEAKQKTVPGEKDELADNARRLWSTLGGTSAAWTMWYGRRANELARSVTLSWDEAKEPVPPFELVDLNGKTWTVESLKGKVTFLNFWASW
jgi:cytochrome oxidase Cu insertion factor (SCO1/SenC/PrrC family)